MKTNFDSNNILTIAKQFEQSLIINQAMFIDSNKLEDLVYHYLDKNELELANKACESGLHFYQYSSQFYRLKAIILAEEESYDKALTFADKAAQMEGDLPENYILKADILVQSNQLAEAEVILKKALGIFGPNSEELLFCRLSIYEKNGKYFKAFLILKEYILSVSYNEQLLERVYFYTELAQCYKESIKLHKYITENDPYSLLGWYNLGTCYFNLERFDSAVEAYEFAMVVDPSFKMAYLDCAEAYFKVGMYEKSIQIYEEYLENFELTSEIAVCLGAAFSKIEHHKSAFKYYLEALNLDPQNDTAHHQLCLYYMGQNMWKTAKESCLRAIELEASESDYYASLGMVYFHLDEIELAKTSLEKACDLAPDECCKWIQYGIFLLEINLPEFALDIIEEAYLFCPPIKLNFCKAACLFTLGKRKEGFLVLREAMSLNKEDAELLYQCQPSLREDTEVILTIQEYK